MLGQLELKGTYLAYLTRGLLLLSCSVPALQSGGYYARGDDLPPGTGCSGAWKWC